MKKKTVVYHINGKRYKIKFVDTNELDQNNEDDDIVTQGECDPPGVKDRSIRVDRNLIGKTFLTVLLHEIQHFQQPYLSEEAVEENSLEVAEILWNLGYRK